MTVRGAISSTFISFVIVHFDRQVIHIVDAGVKSARASVCVAMSIAWACGIITTTLAMLKRFSQFLLDGLIKLEWRVKLRLLLFDAGVVTRTAFVLVAAISFRTSLVLTATPSALKKFFVG